MTQTTNPKTLSVFDAVAVIVGIIIGAGIFKTPSIVAANLGNTDFILIAWLAGGLISFIGALCYAELSSAYPHAGGDYHYLDRAYGSAVSFLFVWARTTVIQTGSIAMLAFLIGDYASQILNLGIFSSSIYAALIIIMLTGVNIYGIRPGIRVQKLFVVALVLGFICVVYAGSLFVAPAEAVKNAAVPGASSIGSAMIFVLLTYGGWNEGVFLSSEIKDPQRNMVRALMYSIGIVVLVYVAANYIFLRSLGLDGVSKSEAVAADMMRNSFGQAGAGFISLLIAVAALSSMNGVLITSARTTYALGRDYPMFGFLGRWKEDSGTPVNSMLLLGGISLALVALGTVAKNGFVTMVEYTAPVFWLFFLLTGISLFVLRKKEPDIPRPFKTPLYPIVPIIFCLVSAYLLQSSVAYTGKGAIAGIIVLLAGIPFVILRKVGKRKPQI